MPTLIIDAALVRELLPMAECIDAMEPAMIGASNGSVALPPRQVSPLADESGSLLLMPGSSVGLATYGAKVLSLHPSNPARNRPLIQGFVALFDHQTGAPIALLEGAEITGIRTAAASGLATRILAREDAATCGILGAGVHGRKPDTAVAHHHRGDPVPGARRDLLVPADLTVVVGVNVHEAGG